MVAFPFRMGAGFAGDVNRTHPATIEPNVNDTVNPLSFFGRNIFFLFHNFKLIIA